MLRLRSLSLVIINIKRRWVGGFAYTPAPACVPLQRWTRSGGAASAPQARSCGNPAALMRWLANWTRRRGRGQLRTTVVDGGRCAVVGRCCHRRRRRQLRRWGGRARDDDQHRRRTIWDSGRQRCVAWRRPHCRDSCCPVKSSTMPLIRRSFALEDDAPSDHCRQASSLVFRRCRRWWGIGGRGPAAAG